MKVVLSRNEEKPEFVPGPPDGSPLPHLRQPKLKNPEKHNLNQLMYFHYNINEHSMYLSSYPYPTHSNVPPQHVMIPAQMQQQPSTISFKHKLPPEHQSIEILTKSQPRTPLSNQQKPIHSNGSNLIVLQSNSPTNNSITPTYNSQNIKSHHQIIKRTTINPKLYAGQIQQSPHLAQQQLFTANTPVTTHQPSYPTNDSPHLSSNQFYSTTN